MGIAENIQRLNPFAAPETIQSVYTQEQITKLSGGLAGTTNPGAITAPPGTAPPESWFDSFVEWISENWKLAAVAAVALVILIKD